MSTIHVAGPVPRLPELKNVSDGGAIDDDRTQRCARCGEALPAYSIEGNYVWGHDVSGYRMERSASAGAPDCSYGMLCEKRKPSYIHLTEIADWPNPKTQMGLVHIAGKLREDGSQHCLRCLGPLPLSSGIRFEAGTACQLIQRAGGGFDIGVYPSGLQSSMNCKAVDQQPHVEEGFRPANATMGIEEFGEMVGLHTRRARIDNRWRVEGGTLDADSAAIFFLDQWRASRKANRGLRKRLKWLGAVSQTYQDGQGEVMRDLRKEVETLRASLAKMATDKNLAYMEQNHGHMTDCSVNSCSPGCRFGQPKYTGAKEQVQQGPAMKITRKGFSVDSTLATMPTAFLDWETIDRHRASLKDPAVKSVERTFLKARQQGMRAEAERIAFEWERNRIPKGCQHCGSNHMEVFADGRASYECGLMTMILRSERKTVNGGGMVEFRISQVQPCTHRANG